MSHLNRALDSGFGSVTLEAHASGPTPLDNSDLENSEAVGPTAEHNCWCQSFRTRCTRVCGCCDGSGLRPCIR